MWHSFDKKKQVYDSRATQPHYEWPCSGCSLSNQQHSLSSSSSSSNQTFAGLSSHWASTHHQAIKKLNFAFNKQHTQNAIQRTSPCSDPVGSCSICSKMRFNCTRFCWTKANSLEIASKADESIIQLAMRECDCC